VITLAVVEMPVTTLWTCDRLGVGIGRHPAHVPLRHQVAREGILDVLECVERVTGPSLVEPHIRDGRNITRPAIAKASDPRSDEAAPARLPRTVPVPADFGDAPPHRPLPGCDR
jgi:hypothetical protein